MASGIEDSIEALYRVFERYPLRQSTEPCPHCHDPGEEGVLHEHLLRDLTAQQLSGFAGEALTVWGDVVDFKHFLPRIMEITVSKHSFDWPDTESLFGRLAYGRWREWPSDEQRAVEQFLHAFWWDGLGRYPASDDIGGMLTAIAATDVDLTPFLAWWIEQPGEEPLRHWPSSLSCTALSCWPGAGWRTRFGVLRRGEQPMSSCRGSPVADPESDWSMASSLLPALRSRRTYPTRSGSLNRWRLCPTPGSSRERRVTGRDRREILRRKAGPVCQPAPEIVAVTAPHGRRDAAVARHDCGLWAPPPRPRRPRIGPDLHCLPGREGGT